MSVTALAAHQHHHPLNAAVGELVVLKFGSSVLRSPDHVPEVAAEIARHVRRGHRVLAVVSAFAGHTDRLLGEARRLGGAVENPHLPAYVALGEELAAALLAVGCDALGLDCQALGVRELGIVGQGPAEDAAPVRLGHGLAHALARHQVVIAPGFGAVDASGRVVLLGRGGSDLTAVFLAAELGLDRVRLVKDVDGVYDADPARGGGARRHDRLSWSHARAIAGRLVQARAIDVAEDAGVAIEVAAMGREDCSVIGEGRAVLDPAPAALAVA